MRIKKNLMSKVTETTLEINLASLKHNFEFLKSKLNENTLFLAVVKAFAYGSDATAIADCLQKMEVDYFAVHDCLFAPAGNCESMMAKARQALYDVITSNPFQALMDESGVSIPLPPLGDADVSEVLNNPYTFS